MADFVLRKSGRIVTIDDADYEWAKNWAWFSWKNPAPHIGGADMVIRDEILDGRRYRVMLHREVASRMFPDLNPSHIRAKCLNGDYMDCRRENISVRVVRGATPKGQKISSKPKQRYINVRQTSALWASGRRVGRSKRGTPSS